LLKNRVFNHTRGFDDELLEKTGIHVDFARIWKAVGWSSFADVSVLGSLDLTIQFLCSLMETKESVTFWFFHQEYSFTWKDFSTLLGFHQRCSVDISRALSGYHKESFLESVRGTESSGGVLAVDFDAFLPPTFLQI